MTIQTNHWRAPPQEVNSFNAGYQVDYDSLARNNVAMPSTDSKYRLLASCQFHTLIKTDMHFQDLPGYYPQQRSSSDGYEAGFQQFSTSFSSDRTIIAPQPETQSWRRPQNLPDNFYSPPSTNYPPEPSHSLGRLVSRLYFLTMAHPG
jgi:hypothetical protein